MFLICVHLLLTRKNPIIFCVGTLSRDVLGPIGCWIVARIGSASRVVQKLNYVLFAALSEEQQKVVGRFLIFSMDNAAAFILVRGANNRLQRIDVFIAWVISGVE